MQYSECGKKISKKQIIKFIRKANRELELEGPGRPQHKVHKTSKKDKFDKSSNKVKEWDNEKD